MCLMEGSKKGINACTTTTINNYNDNTDWNSITKFVARLALVWVDSLAFSSWSA